MSMTLRSQGNRKSSEDSSIGETPVKLRKKTKGKCKTVSPSESRSPGTGSPAERRSPAELGKWRRGQKTLNKTQNKAGRESESGQSDNMSSSSGSSSSSSRSTPNKELEKQDGDSDRSSDDRSESGDSSSDSRSDSGDSESGSSKASNASSPRESPGKLSPLGSPRVSPENFSPRESPDKSSVKDSPENSSLRDSPEKSSLRDSPEKSSLRDSPEKSNLRDSPEKSSPRESPEKSSSEKSTPEKSRGTTQDFKHGILKTEPVTATATPAKSKGTPQTTRPRATRSRDKELKKEPDVTEMELEEGDKNNSSPMRPDSPSDTPLSQLKAAMLAETAKPPRGPAKTRTPISKSPRTKASPRKAYSPNTDTQGSNSDSTSGTTRRRQKTPPLGESMQLGEPGEKKRLNVKNSDGKDVEKDYFCWICHKEGPTLTWAACQLCPRSYHVKCLNIETVCDNNWVCPECERVLRAECTDTQSKAMSMVNVDQLCVTLKFALTRMKHSSSEPFLRPVDTLQVPNYLHYIFNPMDLGTLEKNIKKKMYGSTEAFLADTKWIVHNCIVFNGLHHKLTSAAKTIIKICRHEMSEIEICPDCYMNAAYARNEQWFCEPCRFPHTLVWAKLKGYPFWPAKALREENGYIDCRFFGAHDRAWVQTNQVYLLSKDVPTAMKKGKAGFEESLEELQQHIDKLKEKFGTFHYFPPKTPYKDLDASPVKMDSSTPVHRPGPESGGATGNVFTNLLSHFEKSVPSASTSAASVTGASTLGASTLASGASTEGLVSAKEGVFTISDSALADTSPLSLPILARKMGTTCRSFLSKSKVGKKTDMLDKLIKKLQSDDEEEVLPSCSQHSPTPAQIISKFTETPEKGKAEASTSDTTRLDTTVRSDPSIPESKEDPMEVEQAAVSTAVVNPKPNPFLESLVNSCKQKLGVNSLDELKESSSDDSNDSDNDESSSSSDDDDDNDGKSDEADDEHDGIDGNDGDNGGEEKAGSSDEESVKKGKEQTKDDLDKGDTSVNKDSCDLKSDKPSEAQKLSPEPQEEQDVCASSSHMDQATPEQEKEQATLEQEKEQATQEQEKEQTTQEQEKQESMLMQFLTSSAPSQKRPAEEGPASAPKKLRPLSPSGVSSSAAAAGPVSSSHDKPSAQHSTYGFNVDKYFNKAMAGLKDVFSEMVSDILTQGANNVVMRHLQRELEQVRWRHEQQMKEVAHNAELTLAEMKLAWELERDRVIRETKEQCIRSKNKAVEDAKKKQWCAQCGKEAMFYCCWNTSYCDYPCQQRHWPLHMGYCTQTTTDQSHDSSQPTSSLNAQQLTDQVHRAIQSPTASVASKKPWEPLITNVTSENITSVFTQPTQLPPMMVPTLAPPGLTSIYGKIDPALMSISQYGSQNPMQLQPTGGYKAVPQVAALGRNMMYAVRMPAPTVNVTKTTAAVPPGPK